MHAYLGSCSGPGTENSAGRWCVECRVNVPLRKGVADRRKDKFADIARHDGAMHSHMRTHQRAGNPWDPSFSGFRRGRLQISGKRGENTCAIITIMHKNGWQVSWTCFKAHVGRLCCQCTGLVMFRCAIYHIARSNQPEWVRMSVQHAVAPAIDPAEWPSLQCMRS